MIQLSLVVHAVAFIVTLERAPPIPAHDRAGHFGDHAIDGIDLATSRRGSARLANVLGLSQRFCVSDEIDGRLESRPHRRRV